MGHIRYLFQVLRRKLFHSRTYALLLIQAYILYLYTKPVIKFSEAVDYKSSPWTFPFLVSNLYFLFLFMLGIVYYFSDVPFMQHSNMYQIIRTGRRRWAVGQMGAIVLQAAFLMIFNFAVSVVLLLGHCDFSLEWGKLLHTAALTNAADYYGFLFGIPYSALQKFSPIELTALTLVIGTLVISLIGLLMFALSLSIGRIWAVAAGAAMVAMIYFVENSLPRFTQTIAMFVPVNWMRTANIGNKIHNVYTIPPLTYVFAVLGIGIVVLAVFILWRIRKVELAFNKED